jgi:hypothetical protein
VLTIRQREEVEMFCRYLFAFIGTPYYWSEEGISNGNDDPVLGYDCSGLISEGCRAVGWIGGNERLSSKGFYERFPECHEAPASGDLIVYGSRQGGKVKPYHIAAVIDDYFIIEAGGGRRGVDTAEEQAARNAFVRIRPIEWRKKEIIATLRPVLQARMPHLTRPTQKG